jgi:hypothetical protein
MIAAEFGSSGDAIIGRGPAGRNVMKRFYAGRLHARLAIAAIVVLAGSASLTPANAAPPTVTPSPGYDARLQEHRAAQAYSEPVVRYSRPVHRRHPKPVHNGAR